MSDQLAGRRFVPRFHLALYGALLALATGGAAASAAARELEPGPTLEGFPFPSAYSVAMTEDGADLYASGSSDYDYVKPTPGLVWLRRDPLTGKLEFRRNYFSRAVQPAVYGSVLSADERHLFVLTETQVLTSFREAGGSLRLDSGFALPDGFRPQALRLLSPDQLYLDGENHSLVLRIGSGASLSIETTLSGIRTSPQITRLGPDLFVTGAAALRRVAGTWQLQPLATLTSAVTAAEHLLASPDGRYFYAQRATGEIPFVGPEYVTLEWTGSSLVEVARTAVEGNFEIVLTAASIHPQSGDLYIANINTNGNNAGRIIRYRALEGGRRFERAEALADPSGEYTGFTTKDSLAFSADGNHLYATFAGEPIALFEIAAGTGKPTFRPGGAGLRSHFERPFALLPFGEGKAYVLTPNAVLLTRWDGAAPALESSLGIGEWPAASTFVDLVLTPGGGAGVLASRSQLAMVERDLVSGALRLLPATSVRLENFARVGKLGISPDGSYVYATTDRGLVVYYLRRDNQPKLVLAHTYTQADVGGPRSEIRISPLGSEMLLLGNGGPVLLRRSIETGAVEIGALDYGGETASVYDALYSADGRLLYLFRGAPMNPPFVRHWVEILARQNDGSWSTLAIEEAPLPYDFVGNPAIDSRGLSLYRLGTDGLTFSGVVNHALDFELGPFSTLSWNELASVGPLAPAYDPFDLWKPPFVGVVPGSSDVVAGNHSSGNLRLFRRGCGALDAGPCLASSRFRVEVDWRDAEGATRPAMVSPYGSAEAQIFSFFEAGNWEMMVKVLDGCGINDRFWVFAAASTDVGFDIRVTDTFTGVLQVYRSAAGSPAAAVTDSAAFATCAASGPPAEPPVRPVLVPQPDGLDLGNRFVAKATFRTATGQSGNGIGLRTSEILPSGLFYFFSPDNWEVQLKVLDGCAINGHHWVLGAATTDVGYRLEVFDPVSGLTRTYENPVGRSSPAIIDIEAFPCN